MAVIANRRSLMTLFSKPTCIHSHRTRLVLAEKNINIDISNVDGPDLPEDLMDLNPYHTVPTLVDRELVLYEPNVMMEYLDERFPHPPLLPVYPVARAQSRSYICRIEKDWSVAVDKIQHGRGSHDKARTELAESIISIAPIFAEKSFFMSEAFSLVDCCVAPILWRLPILGIELPEKKVKPLLKYMHTLFEREAFQTSLSEAEREMRG